jgi:predicted phosphodiesterase
VTALDAVLADIESVGGVDEYWVLGDHVALGPDPAPVLERLHALPNAIFTRGNTDRYVVEGPPTPSPEAVQADASAYARALMLAGGIAFTQGAVVAAGQFDWLTHLPLEFRRTLPDGTRFLGVHASPGRDDGAGLRPIQGEAEQRQLFVAADADLVCVGHTHWAMETHHDAMRLVNLGSVSNPLPPDLRASYALLDADETSHRLDTRRVEYDHDAVIRRLHAVKYPAAILVETFMRGMKPAPWKTA